MALGAVAIALLGAVLLSGCSSAKTAEKPAPAPAPEAKFPVTITDDASRSVTVAAKPQRIVSLAPANTEILFAIGAGDRVVGVTTYDDYPAEAAKLPKVGDFMNPNLEAIAAAKPDLILATTGVQAETLKKLEDLGATVVAIDPQTLDQIYADIDEVGQLTGEVRYAQGVVTDMREAVKEVESTVAGKERPTVFLEIGQNPLYTVGSGTLLDDLVRTAGGVNVVKQPGYVPYSLEQLAKDDPQVYLATKGSMSNPSDITKRAGYDKFSSVKNGRVLLLEDNLVSRPGPRVVEGLRSIAKALYPDAFAK
jgi:iron complex transport system substrate-binding protein